MGIFGGSSSSSSTLNNAIAFNPIITVGDDNKAESTTKQKGSAEATATAKDEFGMSAGFALGPNSQAQGGPLSRSGDIQPMKAAPARDGNFFSDGGFMSNINPIFLLSGLVFIGGAAFIIAKKRKKK
jgi:LPXTG-motif cell wall-anchored protein